MPIMNRVEIFDCIEYWPNDEWLELAVGFAGLAKLFRGLHVPPLGAVFQGEHAGVDVLAA